VRWEPGTRPLVVATRAGVGLFGRLVERAGGPQLDLVERHLVVRNNPELQRSMVTCDNVSAYCVQHSPSRGLVAARLDHG
jgi:hypothetical protein